MLARVDRVLAPLSWLLAAAVAIMLLAGPQLVAKDETQPRTEAAGAAPYAAAGSDSGAAPAGDATADGKAVFTENCGGCHTLSDAGTSGIAGPVLDDAGLDADTIAGIVRSGRGGMPSFDDTLTGPDIEAVAAYVAQASGGG